MLTNKMLVHVATLIYNTINTWQNIGNHTMVYAHVFFSDPEWHNNPRSLTRWVLDFDGWIIMFVRFKIVELIHFPGQGGVGWRAKHQTLGVLPSG